MAIRSNAVLTLQRDYTYDDHNGITFHFVCLDPGPGEANDYYISLTSAEFDAAVSNVLFRNELQSRLERLLRGNDILAKIDAVRAVAFTVA